MLPVLAVLLVLAGIAAAVVYVQSQRASDERRRTAAKAFVAAWEKRDVQALWTLSEHAGRPSLEAFTRAYAQADRAAGTRAVTVGRPGPLRDGAVRVPVVIRTDDFGALRGTVALPTVDEDGRGRIRWTPQLRLPGLRASERPRRTAGEAPDRGEVLAADGTRLADDAIGVGIAGVPGDGKTPPTGLERIYDDRLGGHPAETLRFGSRVIKRVPRVRGRSVHSTIDLGLTRDAQAALGERAGGVAVIRPRDGAVLALAGLAVSAPQAPGSTYKIITVSGALQAGITDPSESFPARQYATLSGVKLYNASSETCGGSLVASFVHSCNSVFAPLGAELGRKRLVAISERFGFNEAPTEIPAAKPSQIATDLRDDLAVGAAAIGQDRDLATPLQMASVGATIANRGVRITPRIVREQDSERRRVVRRSVAGQVRDMMVGVVRGGTGTAAALPGVTVAGKTGTAELVPTQGGPVNPENTNAWFVAFAPAGDPELAVAVMLLRAGQGGTTAAPIARAVLSAGL